MKRIILPTDFSDNSWKAMSFAAQLYHNIPCAYSIINTYTIPYSHAEVAAIPAIEPLEADSINGLKKMFQRFEELDHHNLTRINLVSKFGSLADTIKSIENENQDDCLVVMGTKGANGLGELFLGTMTTHIIANTKSPIICVPNSAKLTVPKKLMLAIDKNGVDRKDEIATLIEIAKNHNAHIKIVNVHETEQAVLGKDTPEEFVIDFYLGDFKHSYHTLNGEYKEDLLTRFAEANEIGLIALIKRDRGFWYNLFHRSLTKSMSYYSDIPLLILRE